MSPDNNSPESVDITTETTPQETNGRVKFHWPEQRQLSPEGFERAVDLFRALPVMAEAVRHG